MAEITNDQTNYSTKYQIPLTFNEGDATKCTVLIENVTQGNQIYSETWFPYRKVGALPEYTGDLAPILDNAISYTPLSLDFSLPMGYADDIIRVTVTPIDPTGFAVVDIWEFNAYKLRQGFYEYWIWVKTSGSGATLPLQDIYPNQLNCYYDAEKSSTLQVYTYAKTDEANVVWRFNDGTADLPEQFDVSASAAIYAQLNIGLDELLAASLVLSTGDRHRIASYSVTVVASSETWEVAVQRLDHCKFEAFSLVYINKWGLWETLTAPSVYREKITPRKLGYRRQPTQFRDSTAFDLQNTMEIVTPIYDYDSTVKAIVSTNWISEYEMEQWRYASTSDQTFIKTLRFTAPTLIPVNILNAEINIKQRHKDKMYNLEMEVEIQTLNR